MRVSACTPQEFQWLVDRTGAALALDTRGIKATDAPGRIWGMVVYERWMPASVTLHIAIEDPLRARELLRPAFEYPFVQGGKGVLLGLTAANNLRAVRLNLHLGFREVYRIREGFAPGVDLILFEMRREECRWLKQRRKAA